ncbi:hypothetical protein BVRB_9g208990 [Beta vulgaris subsp. vulgaris]|uniref:Uncharacterized protein n=1 Tax=Beta vulgaris subsp. vulgaris TaxID=3555 RepID=A0A0J8EG43_BETVV|nr:hypothetical protein BVRB_9g208990 [Beta vulgaris subsp. vulgaris]
MTFSERSSASTTPTTATTLRTPNESSANERIFRIQILFEDLIFSFP